MIFNCGTIFVSVGDFGAKRPREKSINIIILHFGFHLSVCPCNIILNSDKYTEIKCRTQNIFTSTYNDQIKYLLNLKKLIFCLKLKFLFKNYKIVTNCILQKIWVLLQFCSKFTIGPKFKFLRSIFNFYIYFHFVMKYFKILLKFWKFAEILKLKTRIQKSHKKFWI